MHSPILDAESPTAAGIRPFAAVRARAGAVDALIITFVCLMSAISIGVISGSVVAGAVSGLIVLAATVVVVVVV